MFTISESQFEDCLKAKLDEKSFQRGLELLRKFGQGLSGDLTLILAYASSRSSTALEEAFAMLENEYKINLKHEDPLDRGFVIRFQRMGKQTLMRHPTMVAVDYIRRYCLGLQSMYQG